MSSESTIDYEALTQDALRGVVRRVLEQTVRYGLPGDHHFYISFDTLAPGVILSKRLREKYSEEMTIVLQHRFWDLAVGENYFEVKLTFDGIPERLVVPFASIKVFFDPSVRYGLQFEAGGFEQGGRPPSVMVERGDLEPPLQTQHDLHKSELTLHDHSIANPITLENSGQDLTKADSQSEKPISGKDVGVASKQDDEQHNTADQKSAGESAKIVNLDAFRKK